MNINKTLAGITLFMVMLLGSTLSFGQGQKQNMAALSDEVLVLINQHRASMHLKPLKANPIIVKEAEGHSRNMANKTVEFGHDGFDERSDRIMKKIRPSHASAENVAYGARTAKAVVEMWLESPGHRKNIEGDYNLTGIGIAKSTTGTLYYTQIFIKD